MLCPPHVMLVPQQAQPLFSPQGALSTHNLSYWRADEYIGVGPGKGVMGARGGDCVAMCPVNSVVPPPGCCRGTRALRAAGRGRLQPGSPSPDPGACYLDAGGAEPGTRHQESEGAKPSGAVSTGVPPRAPSLSVLPHSSPCPHRLEELLSLGLRTDEGVTHEVRSLLWGHPTSTRCQSSNGLDWVGP